MMVTFVSQCEKKALNRTRRVLDTFADRIGDNTWQTVITQEGLLAVKKLLRKTATKNTAVSCHWIRSRSRSDLVWVVGNKSKFDRIGRVPVNSSSTQQLYRDDIHNWPLLPLIRALTCLSALLHDWGKANARFQQKLDRTYKGKQGDRLRHEWVSCLLLKALVNNTDDPTQDTAWLTKLKLGEIDEDALTSNLIAAIDKPLSDLPNVAKLVSWLIVSHHRLPNNPKNDFKRSPCTSLDNMLTLISKEWGYENISAGEIKPCLEFPHGLLSDSSKWLSQVKRWAGKLLDLQEQVSQSIANGSYRVILHHARLSLMLGDHYFSSLDLVQTPGWKATNSLIANTQKNKSPKQALDQHLVGVYDNAKQVVNKLPIIAHQLEPSFNTAELKRKSPPAYAWQDKAAKKVRDWRRACGESRKGFFAVNMASTGCGKTFANAKVMMALSDEGDSLRYILALGLRTLTLQTGDEYRERIFRNSDGSDLAVLIGSKAIAELHDQKIYENREDNIELGSESAETLLNSSDEIAYSSELPEEGLTTILRRSKDRHLLYAPVLACTIDHIIAATETLRGGRYILPALRLLSSDLVIDEIDDFTGGDLIAIGRLIHLAGMLGRKVMISSATIPPSLAEGYFNAYQSGWLLYSKSHNTSTAVGCAWIDEFSTSVEELASIENTCQDYSHQHNKFIEKRVLALSKQPARRKACVIDCPQALTPNTESTPENKQSIWFEQIALSTLKQHNNGNHCQDSKTGLNVSFGVIRVANIQPCVQLTRYLLEYNWPENTEVRVMAYHSRQVLLLRHEQEKHLDKVLKRKEKPGQQPYAFRDTQIRSHLDDIAENHSDVSNVMFLLVATPVEEVGRDHDFDWALIEPSSYRSIIQLAGRVRRHRPSEIEQINIGILQYNWRTIKQGDKPLEPRFCFPGYETRGDLAKEGKPGAMRTHDLLKVVDTQQIATRLDAIPRIQERQRNSKTPMALLEHAVIESLLTNYEGVGPETLQGYIQWFWYLTALPQRINRFRSATKNIQLYRAVNTEGDCWFTERDSTGNFCWDNTGEFSRQDDAHQIQTIHLTPLQLSRLWLKRNYEQTLLEQSSKSELTLNAAVMRYGEISLDIYNENNSTAYEYNDQLGLYRKEDRND
ncbi:MAG: type I-F CRISPR-associated helicase Cas3f [Pseudomonadales bacterium]|nr:type I-F CRISPR-associated helicase Cas3f [Pseudomonadales bacterium]